MSPQKQFMSILMVVALLCAGTAITVLRLVRNGQPSAELQKAADAAAQNQIAMMEQIELLRNRVRELEERNARMLAEAAGKAVGAKPAEASAPVHAAEAPTPGKDPVAGPDPQMLAGLAELLTSGAASSTSGVTVVTGRPSRAVTGFLRGAMRMAAQQESDSRATELASRLGLNADQRARVAARLKEKGDARAELLEGLMSDPEGAASAGAELTTVSQETSAWFEDILTPDQRSAYEAWQLAERKSANESAALRSLADMQTALPDLSQEQKDRLYQHYLERASQAHVPEWAFAQTPEQQAAENDAMGKILTPAQAEAWQASRKNPGVISLPGNGSAVIRTIQLDLTPTAP